MTDFNYIGVSPFNQEFYIRIIIVLIIAIIIGIIALHYAIKQIEDDP